ncbi:unnamed protein product [Cylindrotheca closterium]|uniref:Uncharacterized protein n=1 Tax=Cylindrotheca closterium TaxID=2856 RepID=A0AAD2G2S5_9STRA|nr:unnamed protein product [Cylindrotheca closterium]
MKQNIPHLIFCADSSTSLASMVTLQTVDTNETSPPKTIHGIGRGFGLMKRGDSIAMSQAPSLPQRFPSQDMGFQRAPSSFSMDRQDSMANANFKTADNSSHGIGAGKNTKTSLADRFGCLAPILSPTLSESSRKTHKSSSTDSPLTMPRRKPSQQKISLSQQQSRRQLPDIRNATFGDLWEIDGTVLLQ